jgi:hypothetical protein
MKLFSYFIYLLFYRFSQICKVFLGNLRKKWNEKISGFSVPVAPCRLNSPPARAEDEPGLLPEGGF